MKSETWARENERAIRKSTEEESALSTAFREIRRLTAERDAAIADRLFAEGERDAACSEVADLRKHLEYANKAHSEAEADLRKAVAALQDIADSEDEHGVPSTREWMERRAQDILRVLKD